jgi:urease accessory protein
VISGSVSHRRSCGDLPRTQSLVGKLAFRKKDHVMIHTIARQVSLALIAMSAGIAPASAHHVMGGATPATFAQGLLSGLGHPVIGLDHLAFLLAVGLAVGASGLNLLMPAIFVGASAVGVALHVHGVTLPAAEIVVAGSVLIAGTMLARGAPFGSVAWTALFSFAGLFHGYALGESIFGAEATPLAAYLLGLIVIQTLLATATALIVRRQGASRIAPTPRLIGAAICGVGIAVLASHTLPTA